MSNSSYFNIVKEIEHFKDKIQYHKAELVKDDKRELSAIDIARIKRHREDIIMEYQEGLVLLNIMKGD